VALMRHAQLPTAPMADLLLGLDGPPAGEQKDKDKERPRPHRAARR
jgi:hypothetical protein